MRLKTPSPSMVVALIALVLAMTGSAVAAVSFARNSDRVDGLHAVNANASNAGAAGKLVATSAGRATRGKILAKFLDLNGVATGKSFGRYDPVPDNAQSAVTTLFSIPGLGTLTNQCVDQDQRPGVEDPQTNLTFTNTSGGAVNVGRRVGGGGSSVTAVLPNTVSTFSISGSSLYELHISRAGLVVIVHGLVRQDGRGTSNASCLADGAWLAVS
jgi:hypothetical protein